MESLGYRSMQRENDMQDSIVTIDYRRDLHLLSYRSYRTLDRRCSRRLARSLVHRHLDGRHIVLSVVVRHAIIELLDSIRIRVVKPEHIS